MYTQHLVYIENFKETKEKKLTNNKTYWDEVKEKKNRLLKYWILGDITKLLNYEKSSMLDVRRGITLKVIWLKLHGKLGLTAVVKIIKNCDKMNLKKKGYFFLVGMANV